MAFNLATFKTRSLSAVVFVIVMVAGIVLNQWSFLILFSIIHFGCWVEYQKLVSLIDPNYRSISNFHKYGVMIFGWCLMLASAGSLPFLYGRVMDYIGWILGIAAFAGLVLEPLVIRQNKKYLAHSFFGLIYISVSLGLFVQLLSSQAFAFAYESWPVEDYWLNYGWQLPSFVIACMWINDTMAYTVGSLIGKTPLSKISPKKTWEGTIGGIILCAIVAGYLGWKLVPKFSTFGFVYWAMLAGMAAVAGTLGDLLESKLKRLANVKDSGQIMPGHGGFLDRFDSLLLAGPFVSIILIILLLNTFG